MTSEELQTLRYFAQDERGFYYPHTVEPLIQRGLLSRARTFPWLVFATARGHTSLDETP